MITPKFLKRFGSLVQIMSKTYFLPFEWNPKSQALYPSRHPSKIFVFKILLALQTLRFTTSGITLAYDLSPHSSQSIYGKLLTSVWFCVYLWMVMVMISFWRKGEEMGWLFTQLVQMDARNSGGELRNYFQVKYPCSDD